MFLRLVIISIILFFVLKYTVRVNQTGGSNTVWYGDQGHVLASSLKNFNIDEKYYPNVPPEQEESIAPNRIWTYRYLSQYYVKIILDALVDMERKLNIKSNSQLEIPQDPKYPKTPYTQLMNSAQFRSAPKLTEYTQIRGQNKYINSTIEHINRFLNTTPPFLQPVYDYHIATAADGLEYIRFPLRKTEFYLMSRHYHADLDPESEYLPYVYIILKDNKIVGTGIEGLRKFVAHGARDPKAEKYDVALKLSKSGINRKEINQKLKNVLNDRLNYERSKCFNKKRPTDQFKISNETDCVIRGGVWDAPCEKNSDCPYYKINKYYPNEYGKCDINTGYCELPDGMESKSYRYADLETQPLCYNCKKGKYGKLTIGKCCYEQEQPDYAFLGDQQPRRKYRKLFERKKMNWYRF